MAAILTSRAAVDHVCLLDEQLPEPAAIRWHGRFEVETRGVGFAESQILLAAPRA
jgi:hypothetical protein